MMVTEQDTQGIPPMVRWAVWLVEKVGVPTAVAAYVLLSLGPKIDRMSSILESRLPVATTVISQK